MRMPSCRAGRRATQRGATLIVVLMAVALLLSLGLALGLTSATEMRIAAAYTAAEEALYAADAAIERTMLDLQAQPDWTPALAGAVPSTFVDGAPAGTRTLPDGSTLDLAQATSLARCGKLTPCADAEMDAVTSDRPWGANNPRWEPYAYGPLSALLPAGALAAPPYVIVWIGDDGAENDGDPRSDGSAPGNPGSGVVTLRAEAFGADGAHRTVEATVARAVRVRVWREIR